MKYNLYALNDDFEIDKISCDRLDDLIKKRILIIGDQIVNEFLKKQKGKLGVKNLGNELRYNSILKNEFNKSIDKKIIIKLTENRRAFIKVFIDKWIEHNNNEIYYFILENDFGNSSNIVDKSFIRINEIKDELTNFHDYFRKKTNGPNVKFIEVRGFENYHIIDNNGYKSLHLNI